MMPSITVWPLTFFSMTPLTLEDHVSKTEAAQTYRRGLRSLTRDLGKALASRDEGVLKNWRLKTNDGVIKQGTDVTTEEVESLHSNGMVPTWWGFNPFLEAKYGRRDAPEPQQSQAAGGNPAADSFQEGTASTNSTNSPGEQPAPFTLVEPKLPEDQGVRAIVLEHHHYLNAKREHELSTKEARIEKLTDRVLDLVENNQELQSQSNKIANAFQEFIKDQGEGKPEAITQKSSAKHTADPAKQKGIATAEIIEVEPTKPTEAKSKPPQKEKAKKTVEPKKTTTKKKATKKKQAQPKKPKPSSTKKKGTWLEKNLPSFFGSK